MPTTADRERATRSSAPTWCSPGTADDLLIGSSSKPDGGSFPGFDGNLQGFDGNDTIFGSPGHDNLDGGAGDDTIHARGGPDLVFGDLFSGEGNDRLWGGTGKDLVEGFGGADLLRGGFGADQVIGATAVERDEEPDRLDCGPSRDRLTYAGREDRIRRCERVTYDLAFKA